MNLIFQILVSPVTLFLLLLGRKPKPYIMPNTVEQDKSISHITLNGVTFHAQTFGEVSNPPLFILHGGPGNDYRYLLPLEVLKDDYYVIFYDQRGTGLSPRVDSQELSLESSLEDLESIIEYYAKDKKVYLIGHSWGAMLACAYLQKHPMNVEKIVLAEPGVLTKEQGKRFIKATKIHFSWRLLRHLISVWYQSLFVKGPDKQAHMDYFFVNLAFTTNIPNHPLAGYFKDNKMDLSALPYWRYSFNASKSIMKKSLNKKGEVDIDLVKGLNTYAPKVLFITGEHNSIIGTHYQQEHIKHFKNATLIEIKDAGHTMFGDNPKESLQVVRNYFDTK